MRWITQLLLAFAACLASADTITLKRSVCLDADTPVTLAMIADLEGEHAQRLARTILAEHASELPADRVGDAPRYRIDPAMIRDAIDAAGSANWAFLSVRGGTVSVTIATQHTKSPLIGDIEPQAIHTPDFSEVPAGSIGAFARDVVRSILRVQDRDLRIVWPDRQEEFLLQPVAGRTVHVQPIGASDRMPLSITVYDGDRIVRKEAVRAEIRVRRTVRTASRALPRGVEISPDDFTTREVWVGPGLIPAEGVVGQVTARRLEPGTKIESADIEPPLVVERGEQITLHCVSGAIAIRSPARALGNARDGETLIVEMLGTGKKVTARANGAGNAVLVVGTNESIQQPGENR